jgi:hypothetical protein
MTFAEAKYVGARSSIVVKPKGREFHIRWGNWVLSIYLSLPAALGPGVYTTPNRNEYQKQKHKVSGEWSLDRRVGLTASPPSVSRLSRPCGIRIIS